MYKKILKNPAFIFFIIAVLDVILFVMLANKDYWFTPLNINEYIRVVTHLFLYFAAYPLLPGTTEKVANPRRSGNRYPGDLLPDLLFLHPDPDYHLRECQLF